MFWGAGGEKINSKVRGSVAKANSSKLPKKKKERRGSGLG